MGRAHGRHTVITADATDISPHCNASNLTRTGDVHDVTGYGADSRANDGGLKGGTFTCSGWYDDDAITGPHTVFAGQEGSKIEIVRQPEGVGTGKPTETFTAVLASYAEDSPYNGITTWSAQFTIDGDIADSVQA